MTGIFYFSGTGNSLYLARRIQKRTGGEIRFLAGYDGGFADFDKLVIVSPVYGFGLPIPTYEFIRSLKVSVPVYVVLNYGAMGGPVERVTQTVCHLVGLDIRGVWSMKMPENFTVVVPIPKSFQQKPLKKADAVIDAIAEKIANNEMHLRLPISDGSTSNFAKNVEGFHQFGENFSFSDACNGCKHCQDICPVGNIAVVAGAPMWGDRCVACLACLHRCPQHAVLYKKKAKNQYVNPLVDESDIGK